jgi:myo-inositol-1(or 4)-monophosphatase
VQAAGAIALKFFKGPLKHWTKGPGDSPVTAADIAANDLLHKLLVEPGDGWLSEESENDPTRLAAKRVWVVDPIDGTRDYLRNRPGWCVSVALVEDRVPVLGVLAAPMRNELWTAERGRGSFRNGERLRVSPRAELSGARVPADTLPKVDRDLVPVAKPNSIALRIAMVGAGEADLLATLRWGFEWDIAAAALIAEEAGATVSGALGQPLAFNTASGEAFGVLVATPGIHAAAVDRLRERAMDVV